MSFGVWIFLGSIYFDSWPTKQFVSVYFLIQTDRAGLTIVYWSQCGRPPTGADNGSYPTQPAHPVVEWSLAEEDAFVTLGV